LPANLAETLEKEIFLMLVVPIFAKQKQAKHLIETIVHFISG